MVLVLSNIYVFDAHASETQSIRELVQNIQSLSALIWSWENSSHLSSQKLDDFVFCVFKTFKSLDPLRTSQNTIMFFAVNVLIIISIIITIIITIVIITIIMIMIRSGLATWWPWNGGTIFGSTRDLLPGWNTRSNPPHHHFHHRDHHHRRHGWNIRSALIIREDKPASETSS